MGTRLPPKVCNCLAPGCSPEKNPNKVCHLHGTVNAPPVSEEIQEEMERNFGKPEEQRPVRTRHGTPLPQDVVVLPSHYARFAIEPVYFCAHNGLTFLVSNAVKYIVRAPYKHGSPLEDMKKAIRCIVMEAKRLLGDPDFWKPYETDIAKCLDEEFDRAASRKRAT